MLPQDWDAKQEPRDLCNCAQQPASQHKDVSPLLVALTSSVSVVSGERIHVQTDKPDHQILHFDITTTSSDRVEQASGGQYKCTRFPFHFVHNNRPVCPRTHLTPTAQRLIRNLETGHKSATNCVITTTSCLQQAAWRSIPQKAPAPPQTKLPS